MILLLTCYMNQWKWNKIRKYWLHSCNIPFVFVVGNPNLEKKNVFISSIRKCLGNWL